MKPTFLMSPPRADWVPTGKANFISQGSQRSMPESGEALAEWNLLVDAIRQAGGECRMIPAPSGKLLSGMPYTAEAGHLVVSPDGPLYLLPNLTPAHRKEEAAHIAAFCASQGWKTKRVVAPWEGQGDLFQWDDRIIHTYGVGKWQRTSVDAFKEIRLYFPQSKQLQLAYRADPWFHGNTLLGVFHDAKKNESVIFVCADALREGELEKLKSFLGPTRLEVVSAAESLAYTTNSLQVNDTVIAPTGVPERVQGLWRSMGLKIVSQDLNVLFGSGGGAGVCLTNRLIGLGR